MTRSLDFYRARLRHASMREIIHRLREMAAMEALRRTCTPDGCGWPVPDVPHEILDGVVVPRPTVVSASIPVDHAHGLDAKAGRRDEGRVRGTFFTRIRAGQHDCDLRALWEPARLQNVTAALAVAQGGARQARRDALESVLSWLADNPFPFGLHYLSVMECGLRIPVFTACLKLSDVTMNDRKHLLAAIHHHAWITEKRLSLYSSLGNHTVAECVGLVFAGGIFRHGAEGRGWLDRGAALLAQELTHQIFPDGGPAEQSLSYHRFVLDLYWLAVDFLEGNSLRDCSDWTPRLEAGEVFLAAFTDEQGVFPAIGDSDDGHAVGPGLAPRRFDPGPCPVGVKTFSDSGYTVVRRRSGLLLTVDHGPLGMAPLYNHGHADALSFTLGVGGVPFFVDPGTYRYNGVPRHRQYFKGTRAHNTVAVDGQDQARQLTSFIWDKPYTSGATAREEGGVTQIEAWNDGYARLASPVRHRRIFLVAEEGLRIMDAFWGSGTHAFDLHLHLHPKVRAERDGNALLLERDGIVLIVSFAGPELPELVRGQEEPLLGWYSPAYGVLEPTTTIRLRQTGLTEDIHFETSIHVRST